MTKIFLYSIALLFVLASCKKDDEYISFILSTEKSEFKDTSAVLRGIIVAPGRVNISECAFIIFNPFNPAERSRLSLGDISTPGKIEVTIDTLKMGHQYKFFIEAESQGHLIVTPVNSAMTTEGGGTPK